MTYPPSTVSGEDYSVLLDVCVVTTLPLWLQQGRQANLSQISPLSQKDWLLSIQLPLHWIREYNNTSMQEPFKNYFAILVYIGLVSQMYRCTSVHVQSHRCTVSQMYNYWFSKLGVLKAPISGASVKTGELNVGFSWGRSSELSDFSWLWVTLCSWLHQYGTEFLSGWPGRWEKMNVSCFKKHRFLLFLTNHGINFLE